MPCDGQVGAVQNAIIALAEMESCRSGTVDGSGPGVGDCGRLNATMDFLSAIKAVSAAFQKTLPCIWESDTELYNEETS